MKNLQTSIPISVGSFYEALIGSYVMEQHFKTSFTCLHSAFSDDTRLV